MRRPSSAAAFTSGLAIHSAGSYRSIGASTAVFAALGLLAGHAAVRIARQTKARWRVIIRPLASALVVLGLFGAGGQNIDVIAHATGFGAGLLLGGAVLSAAIRVGEAPAGHVKAGTWAAPGTHAHGRHGHCSTTPPRAGFRFTRATA